MYNKYFKRVFDLIVSILGLFLFIIIYLPITLWIKLEDMGPVFYVSKRLGRNGVPFFMYKFRSMKVNSPIVTLPDGSLYNSKDDLRITKIGKFLRETSIDELPQIFNILLGQMSLIGPRPDTVLAINLYPEEYKCFLSAKPGITGYNQAYYRNDTNWTGKMKNDKYYAENISLSLDVKIFFRTIYIVFKRKNLYKANPPANGLLKSDKNNIKDEVFN